MPTLQLLVYTGTLKKVNAIILERKSPTYTRPFIPCTDITRAATIIGRCHRPIIGRLFVLVSKTTKMILTAVHIEDDEVTNDSVISHVSSSTFNRTK